MELRPRAGEAFMYDSAGTSSNIFQRIAEMTGTNQYRLQSNELVKITLSSTGARARRARMAERKALEVGCFRLGGVLAQRLVGGPRPAWGVWWGSLGVCGGGVWRGLWGSVGSAGVWRESHGVSGGLWRSLEVSAGLRGRILSRERLGPSRLICHHLL